MANWVTILLWALSGLGALGLLSLLGILKLGRGWNKISGIFIIVGILGGLGLAGVFGDLSTLSVGEETSTGDEGISQGVETIATFVVNAREKHSNTYDTIEGGLRVYAKDVNPKDSNSNPVRSIFVTNGAVTDTNASLKTGTDYRVVWAGSDNGGVSYDVDYGVIQFNQGYNKDTARLTFSTDDYDLSKDGIPLFATLDDVCSEVGDGSNGTKVCLNAQSVTNITLNGGGVELGCDNANCAADGAFQYDESVGDGTFDLYLRPGFSTANTEAKDAVLSFVWDSSNPPEGNEFTTITAQLDSGTDLGIPSDITSYFENQGDIALGTRKAGLSSTYKFTFTVNEANSDATDDFTIVFDDLGENFGQDVLKNTKGTRDVVSYAGTVA